VVIMSLTEGRLLGLQIFLFRSFFSSNKYFSKYCGIFIMQNLRLLVLKIPLDCTLIV
jgi:hypothetical protein